MRVLIQRWADGQRDERALQRLDRWDVHASDSVSVTAAGVTVGLRPRPDLLPAAKAGVGACLWDSALVLAAHLAEQPPHTFVGCTAVELGAGIGLPGVLMAKLGAHVTLTDIAACVPLLHDAIAMNGLSATRQGAGTASAEELQWGCAHCQPRVVELAARRLDYVLAADACYDDQDGATPDPRQFFATCRQLCSRQTTCCLLSLERRQEDTFAAFMKCAHLNFGKVKRLPHPSADVCDGATHVELYELHV